MPLNKIAGELWVTNVSRTKDVSICDLGIVVRRGKSVNLLARDRKGRLRYNVSEEMINKSVESGSIHKKEDLKVRKVAPQFFNTRIDIAQTFDKKDSRIKRFQPDVVVPDFPDLDFNETTDEEYAAENADMDFIDRKPALSVDPKFKKLAEDDE